MSNEIRHNYIGINPEKPATGVDPDSVKEAKSWILDALSRALKSDKEQIEEAKFELSQKQPSIVDDITEQANYLRQESELTGRTVEVDRISKHVVDIMVQLDEATRQYAEIKSAHEVLKNRLDESSK